MSMKMDHIAALRPQEPQEPQEPQQLQEPQQPLQVSPEVFQQLGTITRTLHDTLQQLGVMPKLQTAAAGLGDARSRLNYIARKTADAADRVLTSVEQAKARQAHIAVATRSMAATLVGGPVPAAASAALMHCVGEVERATADIDAHLTDIMLAQDFHDLTGQVVGKVLALANDLELNLVKLLLSVVPPEQREKAGSAAAAALQGPVVDDSRRGEVVQNQGEVDELLAGLGF